MDKSIREHKRMTETPVARLVFSLSLPAVIANLMTSIYNMADTYFVSSLGDAAVGAVGIVYSLQSIIQAVGFGIAMGASASEGSIAIADIVVMGDSLTKINEAITISKVTSKIVLQNTILALGIKLLVFIINFFNVPVMIWLAIFSDVGVSLLAIIKSLRVKGIFNKKDQKVKEHE